MADFNKAWDDIVSSVKGAANAVAGRAGQGIDLGKAEYDMQVAKRDLSRYYKEFGRLMYQVEKGQLKRDDAVVKNAVDQITETLALMSSLDERTKEIKSRDVSFKKAAPAEEKPEEKPAEDAADAKEEFFEELEKATEELHKDDATLLMKFCPNCNAGNAPDAAFCSTCGHEF